MKCIYCQKEACKNREYCKIHYTRYRYNHDSAYKEKKKAAGKILAKRWYNKKSKEDPKWNAMKQKERRKRNPEKFNYMMAKSFFKKLGKDKKKTLIKEVGLG